MLFRSQTICYKSKCTPWSAFFLPFGELINNKRIKFFQRYGKYLIWPVIIISPITILLGYAGMGILNYFGHQSGKPMNRWFINILAPFEGNHDVHHRNNKR